MVLHRPFEPARQTGQVPPGTDVDRNRVQPPDLAGVAAHPFALRQNVALHGSFDILFGGTRLEIQLRVQGVELEEIAVGLAWRRARPAITDFPKIIAAVSRTVRELLLLGDVLRERARVCGQVEEHPVHPGSHGCVGIVSDQSETLSRGGWVVPGESGRNVRSVTGELFRNAHTGTEIGTLQFQGHGYTSLRMRSACRGNCQTAREENCCEREAAFSGMHWDSLRVFRGILRLT